MRCQASVHAVVGTVGSGCGCGRGRHLRALLWCRFGGILVALLVNGGCRRLAWAVLTSWASRVGPGARGHQLAVPSSPYRSWERTPWNGRLHLVSPIARVCLVAPGGRVHAAWLQIGPHATMPGGCVCPIKSRGAAPCCGVSVPADHAGVPGLHGLRQAPHKGGPAAGLLQGEGGEVPAACIRDGVA